MEGQSVRGRGEDEDGEEEQCERIHGVHSCGYLGAKKKEGLGIKGCIWYEYLAIIKKLKHFLRV